MTILRSLTRCLGVGLAAGVVCVGGCKKPPPPPPPPPPKVYTPPPPEPLDVASLLQTMVVDARVEFASGQSPVDRGLAEAAIGLADAIARGDDEGLRGMLDKGDQQMLDSLMASEQWWDETEKIEAVRVVSIDGGSRLAEEPEATRLVLAVQDPDGAYLMGWAGRKVFEDWIFRATPSSDEERARASAWDGMGAMASSAGMGGGMDELLAGHKELQVLLAKGMSSPDDLSLEELMRLKELLLELEVAPPGALELIEREIAKRQKRETEAGGSGGGGGGRGGGGGDDRRDDPGPGGPG